MRISLTEMAWIVACMALATASPLLACTGIKLQAKDGAVVHGRTLEFGIDLDISIAVIPQGYAFTGTTPLGAGLSYTSKYGAVGAVAFNQPAILDGINEMGLSIGTFYFSGYAEYADISSDNQSIALSPSEFPHWILTQFATLQEVREGLRTILIAPTVLHKWGPTPPPFHYIVFDKSGKSLVIEPIKGQLVVYENKLGVITNSPGFTWHMTYLRNFINLSPWNVKPFKLNSLELSPLGQGSGMVGLPGDFTPPSRFVRAALFCIHATRPDNADTAVYQAFHILNQFDIPLGIVREEKNGVIYTDSTLLTCVRDPQALKYYFKTYEDQSLRVVDLNQFPLEDTAIKRIRASETNQPLSAADISSELE